MSKEKDIRPAPMRRVLIFAVLIFISASGAAHAGGCGSSYGTGGGGGGCGTSGGTGGAPTSFPCGAGSAGTAGTSTTAGAGGAGSGSIANGGNGGCWGQIGGPGTGRLSDALPGAAGVAVVANGNAITWVSGQDSTHVVGNISP